MKKLKFSYYCLALFVCILNVALPIQAQTTVGIEQTPLLALKTTPGLVLLNMSRDHRLFYAAYNDTSDIDGDGAIDVGFKILITYYGYFDSNRCYKYDKSTTPYKFVPVALANASDGCLNVTAGRWHGNWLNWLLTSRMDALRKVLYGGFRKIDSTSQTILEAANIPGDSHVWGKEYRPTQITGFNNFDVSTLALAKNSQNTATPIYDKAVDDGYDITKYADLPKPANGKMHIFLVKSEGDPASTYLAQNRAVPTLRIQPNVDASIDRVWLWSSSERPIGGPNGQFEWRRPAGCFTNAGLPGVQSCPNTNLTVDKLVPFTSLYPTANPVLSTSKYPAKNYSNTETITAEVRVQTCVNIGGAYEKNCTGYPKAAPNYYKPTGVLHDYGETDRLKFGLLTGSYTNNYSGGVVRKDVGTFQNEVTPATGIFTNVNGIVKTIDKLTTYGFNGNSGYDYGCGFLFTSLRTQGQCNMWGAPVAEMMYEGLRYFAGLQPTTAFITGVSGTSSPDYRLGLPLVSTWANPYRPKASGGSPICSRPVQMVIADPVTSFDSDQLPGSRFSISTGYGGALGSSPGNLNGNTPLDVGAQADDIWNKELLAGVASSVPPKPAGTLYGLPSKNFFMGQTTSTNADGNPTPKTATTFATMRGHGPDETNTQGSYYSASVAKYAHEEGIKISNGSLTAPESKIATLDTISIALGTTVPKIEFKFQGKSINFLPFSKSVGGGGISSAQGLFQPTGLITLAYIDSIFNTHSSNANAAINGGRPYIRFMVSFSDMDQGGDNEADANVYYTLSVNASDQLIVSLDGYYQAGSIQQNMGYIISGTTKDGIYLEIGDEAPNNPVYYLDTLPGQDPAPATGRIPANTTKIAKTSSRSFVLGSGNGGRFVPKDPLWYAAKYGGNAAFDSNSDPANYFKVTNPASLPTQMGKAFKSASALAAVASTSVVGVGQRSLGSAAIYQANYDSLTWTSRLYAFKVLGSGVVSNSVLWEASSLLPAPASRNNLYLGRGGNASPVKLVSGGYSSLGNSGSPSEQSDFGNSATFEYLIGDKSQEERKGGSFRNRGANGASDIGSALGDIVNSDPQIISKKDYGYGAGDSTYSSFLTSITTESLAVGSNDGFFHIFDALPSASGGTELLGFMPQAARASIKDLAAPGYVHRYIVDGSIGIGHAKIVVPNDSTANWRSVAVVSGGVGAKTVFAVNTTSQTYTKDSILWEINANTSSPSGFSAVLGNVVGRPAIGKLKNGVWVAIFGNGYNSANGTANLIVVRLADGVILKNIETKSTLLSNGLGNIEIALSPSGDKDTIDYVYGADYLGNIWRFDLSGVTASNTGWPLTGALLFTTASGRPITAELKIGDAPNLAPTAGGKMVYFGTGSYLNASDSTNTTVQALYGVYDDLQGSSNVTPMVAGSELVSSSLSKPSAITDVRTTSTVTVPWYTSGKKGWILPLSGTNIAPGERVIAPPVRYTVPGKLDAFLFTSIVPGTDDCISGVDAWITGVDALTGGYKQVFDGLLPNSVKIVGGSPRGVFVLQDGSDPTLYISQTLFNGSANTSFATGAGGQQTVTINGVQGTTQILGIKLTKQNVATSAGRQIWRQLK